MTLLPAVVTDGDAVVAYGHLFESESGALLCELLVGWSAPQCIFEKMGVPGPQLVPVNGVEVEDLGTYVRVDGVWTDGAIAASGARPAARRSFQDLFPFSRHSPCATPPGGWPGPPDDDQAGQALQSRIDSDPDKHVGLWNGSTTAPDGSLDDQMLVVGTVGDVDSVSAELRSLYPYNLCVTNVEYSRAELDHVAEILSVSRPDWHVYVVPSLARVVVRLVVFDRAAAEATRPYADKLVMRTVVQRADG